MRRSAARSSRLASLLAPLLVLLALNGVLARAQTAVVDDGRPRPATGAAPAAPMADRGRAAPDWREQEPRWYRITLDGQPCGWMMMQTSLATDGSLVRTQSTSQMRFGRAGAAVEIRITSRFDESADGTPREAHLLQELGQGPVEQLFRFDPEDRSRVTVVSKQGGRSIESTLTLPNKEWMAPAVADAFAAKRRASGAAEFSVHTIDLATGVKLVERRFLRDGESTFSFGGRDLPVSRWRVTDSLMPVPTVEEWSSDSVMTRNSTTMAMGKLDATLSEKAVAQASLTGAPVEVMVSTLVKPDRPVKDPLGTAAARFRVRTLDGSPLELPSTGAQRAKPVDAGVVELQIDEKLGSAATTEEQADPKYRVPSVSIDAKDEVVRALATRALEQHANADAAGRAEALRRAVHRHIRRKGLASAFATASETARSGEGDCTEHAVLLAAMLRAEGIPSRVVTGLVFCPEFAGEQNVFGWHMWTQAIVDGQWLDLDATLPGGHRFHGAHIATGTSAQDQGALDGAWASLIGLMGNLSVEVVETTPRERSSSR